MASNKPILVITSGANRVSMAKLSAILGSSVKRASADQVKEFTGYSIGGVPPLAHTHAIQTFVDRDLRNYKTIWAAAGTAHAVFETTPDDLIRVTGGEVVDVRE